VHCVREPLLPMFPKIYPFLPFLTRACQTGISFLFEKLFTTPDPHRLPSFPALSTFDPVRTSDFHFELPDSLIAQHPTPRRDASRLLVLDRSAGHIAHERFADLLKHLRSGDVLVLNNSKVIPARLRAVNPRTVGRFELLLLSENGTNDWWAMMRPGKRARIDTQIQITDPEGVPTAITATVLATNDEGHRRLRFDSTPNIRDELSRLGEIPLPPYIRRNSRAEQSEDLERYQTVYAQPAGSVAAPTAGLHFTPELLEAAAQLGVEILHVTLHVGLGTFAPVKADHIEAHTMHREHYEVPAATAESVTRAKQEGRRIIAVGTTSVRVLESAGTEARLPAGSGSTNIFIHPPYRFRWVDALLTNFHLPYSTLLMLVSAFAAPGETRGRDMILQSYAEAIRERYRFFSYGDAMLLL